MLKGPASWLSQQKPLQCKPGDAFDPWNLKVEGKNQPHKVVLSLHVRHGIHPPITHMHTHTQI